MKNRLAGISVIVWYSVTEIVCIRCIFHLVRHNVLLQKTFKQASIGLGGIEAELLFISVRVVADNASSPPPPPRVVPDQLEIHARASNAPNPANMVAKRGLSRPIMPQSAATKASKKRNGANMLFPT